MIHINVMQGQKENINLGFALKSARARAGGGGGGEGVAEGMCRHPMAAGHVCNQINLHSRPLQVNGPW